MNNLADCHFVPVQLYLEKEFPKVELLGQKGYIYVILMNFTKLPSMELGQYTLAPTMRDHLWEHLFSLSIVNKLAY